MDIHELIQNERSYQQRQLKLIPSENYVSKEVMQAVGSVFMNKYAEGQTGKRYYHGNQNIDAVENLCKSRALDVFGLSENDWHVNVQAVTGSIANFSVYAALLEPGDKILAMHLPDGGHLSHGWKLPDGKKISFSSRIYDSHFYHVSPETQRFDYDEIAKIAKEINPKIIISGGTAYPRTIEFEKLAKIAHDNDAYYLADVAHESGLIAGDQYPAPFEHADIVTMTTRKTLRGPIGSLIFTRKEHEDTIDRAVFPGMQGGPMINSIAGIAVALKEAQTEEFQQYTAQIRKNADTLAEELITRNFKIITGGTDSHLILIDIRNKQPDGLIAAEILEHVDIITNKNTIPQTSQDTASASPWRPFGLRIGVPAVTTRGMKEDQMKIIAKLIDEALDCISSEPNTKSPEIKKLCEQNTELVVIRKQVHQLTDSFPIYQ